MTSFTKQVLNISDPPFALPPLVTITLDLPFPPSTNRLWRVQHGPGKRVRLSEEYKAWISEADMAVIGTVAWRTRPKTKIAGHFECHIQLNDSLGKKGDCDNLSKALLDWAQSRALILNDNNCRRLIVEWTEAANAPRGARLTLREMMS